MWISLITMISYSELHYGNMTHYDLPNDSVGHSNGFIFSVIFAIISVIYEKRPVPFPVGHRYYTMMSDAKVLRGDIQATFPSEPSGEGMKLDE